MGLCSLPLYEPFNADLFHMIRDQLPRALQDKLNIEVSSDPYHLRTRAVFVEVEGQKRRFDCVLEDIDVGGRKLALKIPETFLAHLSAVL